MAHLTRGCFRFLFRPCNLCARSFALDANRIAGTSSPEPEHPPDRTATVAKLFYCFSRCGDVSTVLLNSPRSSLFHLFTLYRALVAGPWSAMAAARRLRGRSGRERVERE